MTAAAQRRHCNARECAMDVLRGYFDRRTADVLLWEYTCFPMDCNTASQQAHALIAEDLGRIMAL